jgi:hypothetical protein
MTFRHVNICRQSPWSPTSGHWALLRQHASHSQGVSHKRFRPRDETRRTDDFRLYYGMECSENDGDAHTTEKEQSWQRTAESNTLRGNFTPS